MHRIEGANNTKDSNGNLIFTDGPPATTVPAAWLNSVQEEISNVIESAGIQLLAAGNDTRSQLYSALVSIIGEEVANAALGEFIEVTTGVNASKNKNYIANRTGARATVELPTDLVAGNFVGIYGKGTGGWVVSGNYIFYGYKKLLLSGLYNDSIRILYISDTEIKVDFRGTQNQYAYHYGFFIGGFIGAAVQNKIDYIDLTLISGNGADRGDLTVARAGASGVSSIMYGFACGGNDGALVSDVIDYIDMSLINGNATDKGDLTVARQDGGGVSGIKYGFIGGSGLTIDYIDVTTTTGNAIDSGDLTVSRSHITGVSSPKYGFFCGGSGVVDIIEYIDITSVSNNSIDRGNLTVARDYLGACESVQYGFIGGGDDNGAGSYSNVIDYIDLSLTSGNASDSGDLTVARRGLAGTSGIKYGFFGGGYNGANSDVIDYIDMILINGNAADRGDLTAAINQVGAV